MTKDYRSVIDWHQSAISLFHSTPQVRDLMTFEVLEQIGQSKWPLNSVRKKCPTFVQRDRTSIEEVPDIRQALRVISSDKVRAMFDPNKTNNIIFMMRGLEPHVIDSFILFCNLVPGGFTIFKFLNDNFRLFSRPRNDMVEILSLVSDSAKKWPEFWDKIAPWRGFSELNANFGMTLDTKDFPTFDIAEEADNLGNNPTPFAAPGADEEAAKIIDDVVTKWRNKTGGSWAEFALWYKFNLKQFVTQGSMGRYRAVIEGKKTRITKAASLGHLTMSDFSQQYFDRTTSAVAIMKRERRAKKPRVIWNVDWSLFLMWAYFQASAGGQPSDGLANTMMGKTPMEVLKWASDWLDIMNSGGWAFPADTSLFDHGPTRAQVEKYIRQLLTKAKFDRELIETFIIKMRRIRLVLPDGREICPVTGVASGEPYTSFIDTIINLSNIRAAFAHVSKCFRVSKLYWNDLALGDDYISQVHSDCVAMMAVAWLNAHDVPVHPSKNWVSKHSVEFLRNNITKDYVGGYLTRVVPNWIERSPDTEVALTPNESMARAWGALCDSLGRGSTDQVWKCYNSELAHFADDHAIMDSVTTGGYGYGKRRGLYVAVLKPKLAPLQPPVKGRFSNMVTSEAGEFIDVLNVYDKSSELGHKYMSSLRGFMSKMSDRVKEYFVSAESRRVGTAKRTYIYLPQQFVVPNTVHGLYKKLLVWTEYVKVQLPLYNKPFVPMLLKALGPTQRFDMRLRRSSIAQRWLTFKSMFSNMARDARIELACGNIYYDKDEVTWFPVKLSWMLPLVSIPIIVRAVRNYPVRVTLGVYRTITDGVLHQLIPILRATLTPLLGM